MNYNYSISKKLLIKNGNEENTELAEEGLVENEVMI